MLKHHVLLLCLGSWQAILAMLHPKRGPIRFNDGEAAYLRSCTRRFGWERRSDLEANCLWEETFSGVKLHDVVWWLIEEILQTHVSAEACIRHDPITIAKARHSLAGISEATLALHADIIAWQQNNQSSSLPSDIEDSKLFSRISNYMDAQRNRRWKKLYVAYPFKLLAGYSVGKFTWHRSTTRAKGAATNSRHTSCCSTRSWPGKTVTGRNVWRASATTGCAIWRPAAFLVWTSYMVYGISWSFPLRRWSTFFETRGSHRSRWSVSIPSHAWWTGLQCWRWICGCTSTWRSNTALANCSL